MRLRMLMAIVALVGCASNRSSDEPEARIRDSAMTARDTVESSDTSHGTREMPGIRSSGAPSRCPVTPYA